ncbi:MAG: hypothetical protein ABL956_16055 [Hyphomonadaceae bacterium]
MRRSLACRTASIEAATIKAPCRLNPIVIAQPPTAPFIAINARPPRPAANAAKT